MNTTNILTYNQAAEMIYSKEFTSNFLKYLYGTKNKMYATFARKYRVEEAHHEDVTEFVINDLSSLLEEHPSLFNAAVWDDQTFLYQKERCTFFKIFLNSNIDRYRKYVRMLRREESWLNKQPQEPTMKTKRQDIDVTVTEAKLVNQIAYRKAWFKYTETLNSIDKVIAMHLLDGCITMKEVEVLTGLKKSAIYLRIPVINAEINKLAEDL